MVSVYDSDHEIGSMAFVSSLFLANAKVPIQSGTDKIAIFRIFNECGSEGVAAIELPTRITERYESIIRPDDGKLDLRIDRIKENHTPQQQKALEAQISERIGAIEGLGLYEIDGLYNDFYTIPFPRVSVT